MVKGRRSKKTSSKRQEPSFKRQAPRTKNQVPSGHAMLKTHFIEDTPLAEDTSAYGGLKARCAEDKPEKLKKPKKPEKHAALKNSMTND